MQCNNLNLFIRLFYTVFFINLFKNLKDKDEGLVQMVDPDLQTRTLVAAKNYSFRYGN